MSLKDEFKITENTWNAMIRRGVISCSVSKAEEILACLKKHQDSGLTKTESVKSTAIEMNVSDQWVYEVIRRYH
jgi:hypothetical protein